MYTCWCVLSMVYQHEAKRYMPEETLLDIRNVRGPSKLPHIIVLTSFL
jgi:hypothetical protein